MILTKAQGFDSCRLFRELVDVIDVPMSVSRGYMKILALRRLGGCQGRRLPPQGCDCASELVDSVTTRSFAFSGRRQSLIRGIRSARNRHDKDPLPIYSLGFTMPQTREPICCHLEYRTRNEILPSVACLFRSSRLHRPC